MTVAQNKINTLNNNDTANLFFARGDKWSVNSTSIGAKTFYGLHIGPTAPIVNIDAYGSGDKPIFDGLVYNFGSVPFPNGKNGPTYWNRFFQFDRKNCSVKNVEIRRVYGHAIFLNNNGNINFTLQYCNINNFGNTGISAPGGKNVTIEYNTFHTGQQLHLFGKVPFWGAAIQTKGNYGGSPSGGITRYNLVYDISGEGINVASGVIEYNVIGNTGSVGIDVASHNWDATAVTARYNLVTMADWGTHVYDQHKNGGSVGIRVADEKNGGENIHADVKIYGNLIINRLHGIQIVELFGDTNDAKPWGPIRVFNNTIIDSHKNNFMVANTNNVFPDVKIYNNASILYDRKDARHVNDALKYRAGWI